MVPQLTAIASKESFLLVALSWLVSTTTSNSSLVSAPIFIKKVEQRLRQNEEIKDADVPSIQLVQLAFLPKKYPHHAEKAAKY